MNTNRRKFLGQGGIIGAFIGGVASAPIVIEKIKEIRVEPEIQTIDPTVEAKLDASDSSSVTLQLSRTYGEFEDGEEDMPSNSFLISPQNDVVRMKVPREGPIQVYSNSGKKMKKETMHESSVGIVPGPDGKLYVKINGKWQRVLTT